MLLNVIGAELERLLVRRVQALLPAVFLFHKLLNDGAINPQQLDQRTGRGDILHQNALARFGKGFVAHLRQGVRRCN